MINSIWSALKAQHFVYMISKNLIILKAAVLTLYCWCSPQKGFLDQKTFVWAKIISRVEELEILILNFTVYLWNIAIGWNLFHEPFVMCPSFCKEPQSAILFLILNKRFMSLIDRLLKQCLCRKNESVGIKINCNLNMTDYKEMEAEWGPSVTTVFNTLEPRIPVIYFKQE